MTRSKLSPSYSSISSSVTDLWGERSMPISSMTTVTNGSGSPFKTPAEAAEIALPIRCFASSASIGERTWLWPQRNRTACGLSRAASAISHSALPMQRADQREEPACGIEIDGDLVLQALDQKLGALVVKAAAAHVDRLDLRRRFGANRRIVALAHGEVVLHHAPEGREREKMGDDRHAVRFRHLEDEPPVGDRDLERVGPAVVAHGGEAVLFQ